MTSAAAGAVTSDADSRERLMDDTDDVDIVEVQHEHVNNAAHNNRATYRVFYEDRDSRADEWDLEQLARAIYRSTSVILCLTPDYLRDRRRQYEMALAHDAMVHRYGVTAKDHVIVIVLRESGEVASHVPDILRGHFNRKDVIVWNTDTEQQQRHCRSALQRRLSSNSTNDITIIVAIAIRFTTICYTVTVLLNSVCSAPNHSREV
jgi:DICT domain-containing protein